MSYLHIKINFRKQAPFFIFFHFFVLPLSLTQFKDVAFWGKLYLQMFAMEVTLDWLIMSNCPLCCCPSPISTQCWPIPYFTLHPPLVWMATNWQWLLVAPPVLIIAPCIQRKNGGFHRRYTMSRKQPLFFKFRYSEYKIWYLLLIWAVFFSFFNRLCLHWSWDDRSVLQQLKYTLQGN